jgi:hypothetical protein
MLGRLDARTEPALKGVGRFEHEAIMAFAADALTVGIARYLRACKPGSAEVTVTVADNGGDEATRTCCSNGLRPGALSWDRAAKRDLFCQRP